MRGPSSALRFEGALPIEPQDFAGPRFDQRLRRAVIKLSILRVDEV